MSTSKRVVELKTYQKSPGRTRTAASPASSEPNVREALIEKYLVSQLRLLRQFGIRVRVKKIGGVGWRGWPDRMLLFAGGVTQWAELKRPKGGKFEPLQLRMHRELRELGFVVVVLNTKAAVDAYIADLLRELRPKEPKVVRRL